MAELKPCPNCGDDLIWTNRFCSKNGRLTHKYYLECVKCHWCSETKLFLFRAMRAWNKRTPK